MTAEQRQGQESVNPFLDRIKGLTESKVLQYKPAFKDVFKNTGIVLAEILPKETIGGRAPIRPHAIRFSGRLIEVDTMKRADLYTVVIDLEDRTIAYCGKRVATDQANRMLSEGREGLKPRALQKIDDVISEISAFFERASNSLTTT